jgi:hypothetical protein
MSYVASRYIEESTELLLWIQTQIPDCNIVGFAERQWADGKAVSALVHALARVTDRALQ